MESQNIEELSLQDDLREPFSAALGFFSDLGVDLRRVLWVMPRVEALGRFKSLWVERMGGAVCVAPHIQTADRLSQTVSQGAWLRLQDQLVGVLKGLPQLCGGLSTEQLWGLAQEYLELAMRLVMVGKNSPTLWQRYMDTSAFAAQEVQVVLQVAQTFEAELLKCLPLPDVSVSELDLIVWFDDAELMPSLWFQYFFPELPVRRVVLPRVEGARVWEDLAARLMGRVHLSLAPDETAQARQAADQVLRWLREDANKEVAIAVLDRLAARRLVAQLAELGVLVDDRTGWRLSTSNVAGWFDALLCQHVEHGQVLVLEHPFTGQALAGFQPWARTGAYGLSEWANAYEVFLGTYGLDEVLQVDEAGRLLLTGLRTLGRLQSEVEWDAAGFLAAWRHWAEGERFRPLDIESPVRLVPLLSTRLCRFDRVLVLGCAQSHLQESPPGLLPPAVAQALGFPGPKVARIQKLSALYELLSLTPEVCLVHAERAEGQAQVLLPELLWLEILLKKSQAESWLASPQDDCVPVEPKPVEPLSLVSAPDTGSVPAELRVTALDDWVACPLRFGLKHALPWSLERIKTEASFEQLRGIFVHQVFERVALHMSTPNANRADLSIWQRVLWEQGQAVFHRLSLQQRAVLHPFMAQFEGLVPRIAGRLMHRHIEGLWRFDQAEKQVRGTVALSQCGRAIQLSGRLDRLERQGERWAISDIKFKRPAELKKQAADPLSVPQLPMYQYLIAKETGVRCEDLSFLAVSKEGVEWIDFEPLPEAEVQKGFSSWGEVLFEQLSQALDVFFSKDQVWLARPGVACQWCDVLHVCRPDSIDLTLEEEGESQDEASV